MVKRVATALVCTVLTGYVVVSHVTRGNAATSNLSSLNATSNNIHLALIFNGKETDKSVETGKVDYVWGADHGWNATDTPAAGVAHTYYTMFSEDVHWETAHDLSWFKANHPDWIVYKCDGVTPADSTNVALDVTNPAVQQYKLGFAEEAMTGGFEGIAFDNTLTENYDHKCGHYSTSGQWVQQYSGDVNDSAYRQAYTSAFQQVAQSIHDAANSRGMTFTITINSTVDVWRADGVSMAEDLMPYTDLFMDEEGFTNGGYTAGNNHTTGQPWSYRVQAIQHLDSLGKGLVLIAQEPYQISSSNPPPRTDVQWVLANYLLVKNDHTYQATITGPQQYGGPILMQPEYSAPVGSPTGAMYQSQGVWMRDYSNGLVLVNPDPSNSYTVSLPANTYKDLYGNSIAGQVNLPASGSGMILLKSSQSAPPATATVQPTSTQAAPTSTPVPTATRVPTSTAVPTVAATSTPVATTPPASTSTPVPTSSPVSQSPSTSLAAASIEAESSSLLGSVSVGSYVSASQSQYIQFNTAGSTTQSCSSPNYGSVAAQAVSIPATGRYVVWSRITGYGDSSNSYWLQIDNGCPIDVGDQNGMGSNYWVWLNYRNGSPSYVIYSYLSAGQHVVRLFNREGHVFVDRVIFTTDTSCVPSGTGSNCATVSAH